MDNTKTGISHKNYIIRYEGNCNGALVKADVYCKAVVAPRFIDFRGIGVPLELKTLIGREDRDVEPGELWLNPYTNDRVEKLLEDTLDEMGSKLRKKGFKNGVEKRNCKAILFKKDVQEQWRDNVTKDLMYGADGQPKCTLERMPVEEKKMEIVKTKAN